MSSLKYRPEIDGLRAIAVLAVVIYHANISSLGYRFLPGGFLGVDIFFVISGYLISKIILTDMSAGNFSFLKFYERRARRILPALFLVILVTIPFALLWLLPKPFEEFTSSIAAALGFASNFFFLGQDSYTAVASDYKPLLHTWSLAVEEQFYLLFPPLLLLLFRSPPKVMAGFFFLLFTASLAAAQALSYEMRDASFYLLPTRAWELVAGYIIAKRELSGRSIAPSRNLTWAGLILIVLPLFLMDNTQHHPGVLTFIPVLGAMMILAFGRNDKILSLRPVVFTGLISYSFYLWHQPVFALARVKAGGDITDMLTIGLTGLSFVLAVLSWRFVERPFRDKARVSAKTLWIGVVSGVVILGGFCLAQDELKIKQNYFPEKGIAAEAISTWDLTKILDETRCMKNQLHPFCIRGDQTGPRWIMLGDSQLERVSGYLWQRLKETGITMTFMERGGCGYLPGMETLTNGQPDVCTFEVNQERKDFIAAQPPGIIVIMARYPLYIDGKGYDNGDGGVEKINLMMRPNGKDLPEAQRKQVVEEGITQTMKDLLAAGHKLVLVYPTPESGWDVTAKVKTMVAGMEDEEVAQWLQADHLSTSYKNFRERTKRAYAAFDRVPDGKNVLRIYPEKLFCNTRVKGRCVVHDDKALFYADDNHLSKAGALMLVDDILNGVQEKWGVKVPE